MCPVWNDLHNIVSEKLSPKYLYYVQSFVCKCICNAYMGLCLYSCSKCIEHLWNDTAIGNIHCLLKRQWEVVGNQGWKGDLNFTIYLYTILCLLTFVMYVYGQTLF